MADETLPPEFLPRHPGAEVMVCENGKISRVIPDGDDWRLEPVVVH